MLRSASNVTRSLRALRISAAAALPSRMFAVIGPSSVIEVPHAGEVQGQARLGAGVDDQLVTDGPAGLREPGPPALAQDLNVVREREVSAAGAHRADRAIPGPGHGQAAGVAPVDLPHPD